MKRRALPAWIALGLAASCAIPELRVDPDLDPDKDNGGGTSGTGGDTSGTDAGGASTGGATGKGGAGGADAGKGGAATGGKAGAATGGKAGAAGNCEDSGLTTCGGVCVNTANDPLRCGSCDIRCTNGHGCSNGRCVCPPGYRECSGVCADLTSDPANCGACGTPCDLPLTCTDGSCEAVMCETLTGHVDLPQLDNFEDGDSVIAAVDGRVGYWWTYGEEVTNCVVSPVPELPWKPVAGGPAGSLYAIHVTSQGCEFAGLGCDLNNLMGKNCPLDATAFTGIRFRYLSPTTPVRVQVGTLETLSVEFGGDCTAACDDLFGFDLPAAGSWTTATAPFSSFTQSGGGTMVFRRTGFMSVQFTAPAADGFDFWVDQIEFY